MEKVYSLPDLPRLPYSDLQALLVRLLEYGDFSVLPPLFDLLQESGESALVAKWREDLTRFVFDEDPVSHCGWDMEAESLLRDCFHLIYTTDALVQCLMRIRWPKAEPSGPAYNESVGYTALAPYTAEGDIPAGALVVFDNINNTVRIHPNPPVQ